MSQRLLRACHALEVAVTAAGSSVSTKPPQTAARLVLRRLRHLRLVLPPPVSSVPVTTPSERIAPPISEVRQVKPVKVRAEPVSSAWDPEPMDSQLEASRSKALMLEIVRRAIYDWVLYRGHARLEFKEIAADAYTWLFEEEPGHPWWRQRTTEKRMLTSLHAICDVLDLEPETIRARAKVMTIKMILSVGRPSETRRRRLQDDVDYQEHTLIDSVDLYAIDQDHNNGYYEGYYSVSTSM